MKDEIFEKFTWKIENFSRLNTNELYSDSFVLGGYPWYEFESLRNFGYIFSFLWKIYRICWSLIPFITFLYFDLIWFWFWFRRILMFPKGNDVNNSLSIYLEAMQTANMFKGWSRDVKFKLLVFNQINANMTITRGRTLSLLTVEILCFKYACGICKWNQSWHVIQC